MPLAQGAFGLGVDDWCLTISRPPTAKTAANVSSRATWIDTFTLTGGSVLLTR